MTSHCHHYPLASIKAIMSNIICIYHELLLSNPLSTPMRLALSALLSLYPVLSPRF